MTAQTDAPINRTPLYDRHAALGARFVPFAGYEMPVQYKLGVMKEHKHTRDQAGLFDVSHMGVVEVSGPGAGEALEAVLPADATKLADGAQKYSFLLNEQGGVLDDLMVARSGDGFVVVVNAGNKDADIARLNEKTPDAVTVNYRDDMGLLALQGPAAASVLSRLAPEVSEMAFMSCRPISLNGARCHISRSGYTGEDGYEIAVPADAAGALWDSLMTYGEVEAIGLGARDSLRLEAGLCLHGNDITPNITPIEAALTWAIPKARREAGGYIGAEAIKAQLATPPARKRVGLVVEGRGVVRDGAPLMIDGQEVGIVTSGCFGPTTEGGVAMGYLPRDKAAEGTAVEAVVRDKPVACRVAKMPFVPHRFHRG